VGVDRAARLVAREDRRQERDLDRIARRGLQPLERGPLREWLAGGGRDREGPRDRQIVVQLGPVLAGGGRRRPPPPPPPRAAPPPPRPPGAAPPGPRDPPRPGRCPCCARRPPGGPRTPRSCRARRRRGSSRPPGCHVLSYAARVPAALPIDDVLPRLIAAVRE